ncbi:hypothetical protein LOK49_LG12G00181 [Camellia lanceoleosa]|uniref:Uncharacterized protein n=1 Tax=Camellia lanceoleosa TaxID=1840588 RepID=A0ACC0FXX8_9ERIC|nr:hypothetical protein LOK49_LG12G00181 [Camellia lanceoleosa]
MGGGGSNGKSVVCYAKEYAVNIINSFDGCTSCIPRGKCKSATAACYFLGMFNGVYVVLVGRSSISTSISYAVMNIYIKTMTEDHGNEVVAQACVSIVDVMKDIWIHSDMPQLVEATLFCTHHKIEKPEVAQHMGAPIAGNILIAFVADMVKENQIRYDDLALDSNCTQELAGIGSLVKGFRQYLIWDRRRTFKRVN